MTNRTWRIPGLQFSDHEVSVPLNWDEPDGEKITVFAREVRDSARVAEDLPVLLYLQGGPGGKGPRPLGSASWIGEAVQWFRVVLLDQRGTGRSTRIEGSTLPHPDDASAVAEYLTHFRADSIVRDAEFIRRELYGGRRWHTLGQSYGGFLTATYLSFAPEGLAASYVTAGLPPIGLSAREVYQHTYPRVEQKMASFLARYPKDQAVLDAVADRLAEGDVVLPDGSPLSVERFGCIGMDLGMKPGIDRIHWLLDEALEPRSPVGLSETFLQGVLDSTSFEGRPLYGVLQEAIYADGPGATGWGAQTERDARPAFSPDARPFSLTGEMVYPFLFDEVRALRPFRDAVHILAEKEDWTTLYDVEQLARNEVPVAAGIWSEDMFVESTVQQRTLAMIRGGQEWLTNEFEHDGVASGTVLTRLRQMVIDAGGPLE